MQTLVYFSYGIQILAIIMLFINSVYVLFQRPSKVQMQIFVILISTIVMLVGYLIELTATNVESAMMGVYVSYLGKPFALLGTTMFIASYCGHPIPRKYLLPLIIVHAMFPVVIFTNGYHYLYYSFVEFDRTEIFSPLTLGHGPIYFAYMFAIFANSLAVVYYTFNELKVSKTAVARKRVIYLFAMLASTVIGYLWFLTGKTMGFDTTMLGAIVAAFLITLLFFKYNIFDLLTLAREKSFQDSSTGLIVLSPRGKIEYSNTMMNSLLSIYFTLDELRACPAGITICHKEDLVFEVKRTEIEDNGHVLGEFIEVNDITEKHNYSANLEREVDNRTKEIRHIQRTVIGSFAEVVEARDSSTGTHIKSMSKYVEIIAKKLKENGFYSSILTDDYITALVDVAPLHDIGKLSIPDSILLKPAKLSEEEFNLMKTHTKQGAKIIEQCLQGVETERYVSLAKDVAMYHHEKWSGGGYPAGLRGEEIPLTARIVALADVFDAISTERCYKEAYPLDKCFEIITADRGTHFDPAVVDAFMSMKDEIIKVYNEENVDEIDDLQLR